MPKPRVTLNVERTSEIIASVFTNPIFSKMHQLAKMHQTLRELLK